MDVMNDMAWFLSNKCTCSFYRPNYSYRRCFKITCYLKCTMYGQQKEGTEIQNMGKNIMSAFKSNSSHQLSSIIAQIKKSHFCQSYLHFTFTVYFYSIKLPNIMTILQITFTVKNEELALHNWLSKTWWNKHFYMCTLLKTIRMFWGFCVCFFKTALA